jgi:hypothetical protein
MQVDAEYMTSDGRIDLLIRTSDYIYIIECKLDASAKIALRQIERKDYPLPWSVDKRTIFLIGLNFSSKTRRLEEWQIGQKSTGKDAQKSTPKSTLKSTLKGTRKSILEIIKSNPNITLDQVAAQLRKNPRGIDKHIKILREQGLLRRVDGNNGGHWEIIDKD